jgi:hypothetical protein
MNKLLSRSRPPIRGHLWQSKVAQAQDAEMYKAAPIRSVTAGSGNPTVDCQVKRQTGLIWKHTKI